MTEHEFAVYQISDTDPGAVAGVGDLDGDGYDDYAIAETGGFRSLPSASCFPCGHVRAFSGATGSLIHEWWGDVAGSLFGVAVASAGDVDGDGSPDVVIGAPYHNGPGALGGRVSIYSGATGSVIRSIDGIVAYEQLGASVAGAGDLDGDGTPDLLVGSFMRSPSSPTPNATVRAFSGANGAPLFSFDTGAASDDMFGSGLDGAGDPDGDGFPEAIASGPLSAGSGSALLLDLDAIGTPARARTFGAPCPGSNGHLPRIDVTGRPAPGSAIRMDLSGAIPATTAVCLVGAPIALSLDLIGMTGCSQFASASILLLATTNSGGMATLPLVVPGDAALVGASAVGQWACFDLSANAFGMTSSDGLLLVLGN